MYLCIRAKLSMDHDEGQSPINHANIFRLDEENLHQLKLERAFDWVLELSTIKQKSGRPTSIFKPRADDSPVAKPSTPEEGLLAWVQCVAGFCINIYNWGLLNSFGM